MPNKSYYITLLFIVLIASGGTAYSQESPMDIPLKDNMSFIYNSTVDIDTKFLNAKTWIAKTFGDYKSVVKYEDDNAHKLILKSSSPLYEQKGIAHLIITTVKFTLSLDFKADRYRIKIEDIILHDNFYSSSRNDEWDWKSTDYLKASKCRYSYDKVEEIEEQIAALSKDDNLSEEDSAFLAALKETLANEINYISKCELEESETPAVMFRTFFYKLLTQANSAINTVDDF